MTRIEEVRQKVRDLGRCDSCKTCMEWRKPPDKTSCNSCLDAVICVVRRETLGEAAVHFVERTLLRPELAQLVADELRNLASSERKGE